MVDDWIEMYALEEGDFDITVIDTELADIVPTETQMGKVYTRLILLPERIITADFNG